LLIRVFNLQEKFIYYSPRIEGNEGVALWFCSLSGATCMEFLRNLGMKTSIDKSDYMFKKMNNVQIIQYCRKLAKAGVKFK